METSMQSKDQKSESRRATVPPVKVLELMNVMGPGRAARALGVSTTTLYSGRNRGYVSKVLEVAADGALRSSVARLAKPAPMVGTAPAKPAEVTEPAPRPTRPDPTVICLVEVHKSKAHLIAEVAKALGAEYLQS
jgi:hypothetical protein